MFDSEYFKNLVNETTDLISSKSNVPSEDIEEIEARIESNKLALRLLVDQIEDPKKRENIMIKIDNLYESFDDAELSITHKREVKRKDNGNTEMMEQDISKYSHVLKHKAQRLFDGLEFDKKILDETATKMQKNIMGTTGNVKKISNKEKKTSAHNIFVFSLIVFLIMYFIIRFL